MSRYFPSARSTTLGLIIWSSLLVGFGLSLIEAIKESTLTDIVILLFFWALTLLFAGTIWFRTGYYISDQQLIVKIGPVTHTRIDLLIISKISSTISWISSPANSLKRLKIKSGDKVLVLISPKDQKAFLEVLKIANPKILLDIK